MVMLKCNLVKINPEKNWRDLGVLWEKGIPF